jgi:hypothetical protein
VYGKQWGRPYPRWNIRLQRSGSTIYLLWSWTGGDIYTEKDSITQLSIQIPTSPTPQEVNRTPAPLKPTLEYSASEEREYDLPPVELDWWGFGWKAE